MRWPCRNVLCVLALLGAARVAMAEDVVRIAFVGDVMLAASEGTGELIRRGGDPFAHVRELLASADLRVANFESSAGTRGHADAGKPYSFRTAHAALGVFSSVFEVAGLANNHAGDFGRQDFADTLDALTAAGSSTFGGGRDLAAAHRPLLIERKGVRIALLGYLDFFPRWFVAAPGRPGVAWLDTDQAAIDIARARQAGADVVLVVPHWGVEHEPRAHARQRAAARALLDAGADAVIGGHPHVVQDYEIHRGKPVLYSLGNFVFDGFQDADNNTGWVVFADIDRRGVRSLVTRVVKIDASGAPAPDPDGVGPCWRRGESAMAPCASARPR